MKRVWQASLAILVALGGVASGVGAGPAADKMSVYVGSYAPAKENGIHHFTLDLSSGALAPAGGTSGVANPSFVAISHDKKFLFAIGEVGDFNGKKGGVVSSFAI